MVAMSGAIMPAPLAKPLIVTVALPSFAVEVATLGNVSVVMIALAASSQASGCAAATRPSITPSNALALSGSPITPVEARNPSAGLQPIGPGPISAGEFLPPRPGLPGDPLGVAGMGPHARRLGRLLPARRHPPHAHRAFEW